MKQSFWGLFGLIAVSIVGAALLLDDSRAAVVAQALVWCGSSQQEISPLQRVSGCTLLIESKRLRLEDLALAYNNRGDGKRALGAYGDAVADYNNAIHLGLPSPSAYFGRGVSSLALRNYKQAVSDLSKAIQIDPSHGKAHMALGKAYERLGNPELAVEQYALGIRLSQQRVAAPGNRVNESKDAQDLGNPPEVSGLLRR